MHLISCDTADGVCEQLFTVGEIPGAAWAPAGASGPRPLVLLGHGGGQHKKAPALLARASRLVTSCGFAAAAIDAPGHGGRPESGEIGRLLASVRERLAAGEPAGPLWPGFNAEMARQAVPEWRAVLDALQELDIVGAGGPVGYWGVSMGGAIGVRLAAAEPRITAAVLGLVRADGLTEAAAGISIPVEFLLQWDDDAVPRDSGLALFDAFASPVKSLHANAGGHQDMPRSELDGSVRFFARHLQGSA